MNSDIWRHLMAWNESTAPYALRTDHQHHRHAQRARIADRELQTRFAGAWRELSNGMRVRK